jgi:hypothetical protein
VPSPEKILAGLQLIANRAQTVATLWHIAVLLALIAVVSGWRPSRRTSALALVLPLLSVAIVAALHRGAFNGAVFTVLGIALALLGRRVPADPPGKPPRWALGLGIAMAVLGFVYPHFLAVGSFFWYLYGAPLGVLPCPTLSFVIGVTLVLDGVGSRAWAVLLAAVGLCYGLVGVVRLGVWLDVGLLFGAAGLAVRTFAWRDPR